MGRQILQKNIMNIFIDTTALRSLYDDKDELCQKAHEIINKASSGIKFVLTDYVIDETYTGLLVRSGYIRVMKFDDALRMGSWRVELVTPVRFAAAQEVFRRYNKDKKWSFTDCTSYVVMKELKIKTIFAFDKNFDEMGFKLL